MLMALFISSPVQAKPRNNCLLRKTKTKKGDDKPRLVQTSSNLKAWDLKYVALDAVAKLLL